VVKHVLCSSERSGRKLVALPVNLIIGVTLLVALFCELTPGRREEIVMDSCE
jgi:hypothetical protein